jgi:hypothetical protein
VIDGALNCKVESNLNGPTPYGGYARACQSQIVELANHQAQTFAAAITTDAPTSFSKAANGFIVGIEKTAQRLQAKRAKAGA